MSRKKRLTDSAPAYWLRNAPPVTWDPDYKDNGQGPHMSAPVEPPNIPAILRGEIDPETCAMCSGRHFPQGDRLCRKHRKTYVDPRLFGYVNAKGAAWALGTSTRHIARLRQKQVLFGIALTRKVYLYSIKDLIIMLLQWHLWSGKVRDEVPPDKSHPGVPLCHRLRTQLSDDWAERGPDSNSPLWDGFLAVAQDLGNFYERLWLQSLWLQSARSLVLKPLLDRHAALHGLLKNGHQNGHH